MRFYFKNKYFKNIKVKNDQSAHFLSIHARSSLHQNQYFNESALTWL